MTVGSLVAFIQYMNRIFDPFRDLMGLYFDAIRASVSMQRIFDLIEIVPEDTEGEKNIPMRKDIIFQQVQFRYAQLPILQKFSFTFHYGKKYALVGGSGCGKSTLINLLCRFYEPQKGNISIGNMEIAKINIHVLRRSIALVTQDNQLFHESIVENIRYGKLDGTKEEIEISAIQANIADHIHQLPDEFNTLIGDRGASLSGGQQQRIAIARAILKDADVIILDEATSALDSDSEKNILEHLCRLYSEKTMIIISHRLSAIRNMDEIVCMDAGGIVESGSHEDLIIKKGFYWRLFKEQIE
jgi:ABC-type multidrug transport system fused ATPase/permease subunit